MPSREPQCCRHKMRAATTAAIRAVLAGRSFDPFQKKGPAQYQTRMGGCRAKLRHAGLLELKGYRLRIEVAQLSSQSVNPSNCTTTPRVTRLRLERFTGLLFAKSKRPAGCHRAGLCVAVFTLLARRTGLDSARTDRNTSLSRSNRQRHRRGSLPPLRSQALRFRKLDPLTY